MRHKTNWRELFEQEHAHAAALGCDEVIFLNECGEITEGSRTNVFAQTGGRIVTPPLSCGLLNGCLRQELIEAGECTEAILHPDDLNCAEAVYVALDCDVLDPGELAVFMPEPGGPSLAEVEQLLGEVRESGKLVGVGFTGLAPDPANVEKLERFAAALGY